VSRADQRTAVCALLAAGLSACNVNPIPGATTNALNGSWQVQNLSPGGRLFQFPSPNVNVNIQPQGAYSVAFYGTSPSGVTLLSWRGVGTFYCYNGPVVPPSSQGMNTGGPTGFLGAQPGAWPNESTPFNPPQSTGALLNTGFIVPCGPGGAQGYASARGPNSSMETVTALATDASGAKITATLTLTVVANGGL
jgi:hypothetical protein